MKEREGLKRLREICFRFKRAALPVAIDTVTVYSSTPQKVEYSNIRLLIVENVLSTLTADQGLTGEPEMTDVCHIRQIQRDTLDEEGTT